MQSVINVDGPRDMVTDPLFSQVLAKIPCQGFFANHVLASFGRRNDRFFM